MIRNLSGKSILVLAATASVLAFAGVAGAGGGGGGSNTISNGNFETGNFGSRWYWDCWYGYPACNGDWEVWNKKVTPLTGLQWPSPMQGNWSAVADETDYDTLVLYQEFKVSKANSRLTGLFEWKNRSDTWCNLPFDWDPTDDCGGPPYNQQFRIDVLYDGSDPFSDSPSDVIKTLFQTEDNTPLSQGKTAFSKKLGTFKGWAVLRVIVVAGEDLLNVGVDSFDVNAGG